MEHKCYNVVTKCLLQDESLQMWCQPLVFYRHMPIYRDKESERHHSWQEPLVAGQSVAAIQKLVDHVAEMLKREYILYFNSVVLRFELSDKRDHLCCKASLLYLCDQDRVKNVVAALLYTAKRADTSTRVATAEHWQALAQYLREDAAVLFETLAEHAAS